MKGNDDTFFLNNREKCLADFSFSGYSYGFQGQERDDEVSGNGNSYDFGARIYNSRIGRFFSIDPQARSFESPYAFAANNPIAYIDINGEWPCWTCWAKKALTVISTVADFIPVVGQIKGVIEGTIGYSMDGTKLEPWERALAFIPGGKIASKAVKITKSIIKVTKASKVVKKVKAVTKKIHIRIKPKASQVEDVIHGNSKGSKKAQHVYEIVDKESGETIKYGISGRKLNKNGTSGRANSQVNKLNKDLKTDRFEARILEKDLPGRQAALDLEQDLVNTHAKTHGTAPPGNIRPKPKFKPLDLKGQKF